MSKWDEFLMEWGDVAATTLIVGLLLVFVYVILWILSSIAGISIIYMVAAMAAFGIVTALIAYFRIR